MAARLIDRSLVSDWAGVLHRAWGGALVLVIAPLFTALLPGATGVLMGGALALIGGTWVLSGASRPMPPRVALLAACLGLAGLVLAFLAIMTVLVVTLVTMGIMASSGFDFEQAGASPEAMQAAMDAYRQTPGWQICLGVFGVGLALWLFAAALFLPAPAHSVRAGRLVVLEGFRRSRGRGVALLVMLVLALAPALVASLLAPPVLIAALGTGISLLLLALVSHRAHAVLPDLSAQIDPAD